MINSCLLLFRDINDIYMVIFVLDFRFRRKTSIGGLDDGNYANTGILCCYDRVGRHVRSY